MVKDRKSGGAGQKKPMPLLKYLKLKERLRGNDEYGVKTEREVQAPSEPWVEAQFKTFIDIGPDGESIVRTYHDARVFPPRDPGKPASSTKMRRCRLCRKYTPGPAVSARGICDDCRCLPETKLESEMRDAGLFVERGGGAVKTQMRNRPGTRAARLCGKRRGGRA